MWRRELLVCTKEAHREMPSPSNWGFRDQPSTTSSIGSRKEEPSNPKKEPEDLENWIVMTFGSWGVSSSIRGRWRPPNSATWSWRMSQPGQSDDEPMRWGIFWGWLPRSHSLMKIKEEEDSPFLAKTKTGLLKIGWRWSGPTNPALKLEKSPSKRWSGEPLKRNSNPTVLLPHSRVGEHRSWSGVLSLVKAPPRLSSCHQNEELPRILSALFMKVLLAPGSATLINLVFFWWKMGPQSIRPE